MAKKEINLHEGELTIAQAAERFNVNRHLLSNAVSTGKLVAALRYRAKEGTVGKPIWVVIEEDVEEFLVENSQTGSRKVSESKLPSTPRSPSEDQIAVEKRRRLEDIEDARRLGISYQDYKKIMHL